MPIFYIYIPLKYQLKIMVSAFLNQNRKPKI